MEEKETIFAGIDVGKYNVDMAFGGQGEVKRFKNDDDGIGQILGLLKGHQVGRIVLEASGGYQRQLLAALLGAGWPAVAVSCRLLGANEEEWRKLSNEAWLRATSYSWDDATVLFEKALTEACARCSWRNRRRPACLTRPRRRDLLHATVTSALGFCVSMGGPRIRPRRELVRALRAARRCPACGRRAGKTPAALRSPRTLSVALASNG
jgi:hypothetical protein